MKIFITLFLFMFFAVQYNAQNIVDFFLMIPSKYMDDLSTIERKKLLDKKTIFKDDLIYNVDFNKQNGYLKLTQNYTEGQSGFGIYELAYWNLKNKKLIAISSVMGSNGGSHQNDFKFFIYEKNKLKLLQKGYLKSYSSDFDVFLDKLINDFTYKKLPQEIKDNLKFSGFEVKLPQNGKEIKVSFNPMYEDYFNKNYLQYLKLKEKVYNFNIKTEAFE